jgi:hypothetical protein
VRRAALHQSRLPEESKFTLKARDQLIQGVLVRTCARGRGYGGWTDGRER